MAVPRRLRNTNTQPEKGSSASFSRHSRANESIPLRFCGAPQKRKYAPSIVMRSRAVRTRRIGHLRGPDGA